MSFISYGLRAVRRIAALSAVLALAGPTWAAPLDPVSTHIDASIGGRAVVSTEPPSRPASMYTGTIRTDKFTDGGLELRNDTVVGPAPGFDHLARSGSAAGTRFEQVAENEYMLTLSAAAEGEVRRGTAPVFLSADAEGHARVIITAQFMVLGYPGQPKGAPAGVYLDLEHFGTLSGINNGMGTAAADLYLTASGASGLKYSNRLDIPTLPVGPFQETEFIGRREYTTEYAFFTTVGQIITLNAMLETHAWMHLDPGMPFARQGSNSNFTSGLRLHMTVLPEPGVLGLLLAGTLLCARWRKRS